MIGEIWDYITDGIGTAWETLTTLPELLSGSFTEVNFSGWLILTLIGETILWGFWYYVSYSVGSTNDSAKGFMSIPIMLISTAVTPVICYIFAWRNRE